MGIIAPSCKRHPGGEEWYKIIEKYRYWWGSKAAMSILLRFLSIYDTHILILIATYTAWALLALSLLLMGWRTLLTAAPVLILGVLFSGVAYFADITNGLPYLWTLLATSALALLLLRPKTARWAPLFCFITGMVSAYLWFSDGHTALAMFLIGLIAWLGYARLKQSAPIAPRCRVSGTLYCRLRPLHRPGPSHKGKRSRMGYGGFRLGCSQRLFSDSLLPFRPDTHRNSG